MRKYICWALVLAWLTAPGLLAAEKIKVGTALATHPAFALPMLAANKKDFWKKEGVEVEWNPFRDAQAMHNSLAAGTTQMGIDEISGTMIAISQGVPLIIVADLAVRDDLAIWVKADSPIREPKELKHKKVAVARLGGISHAYARSLARTLGMSGEVEFVPGEGIEQQMAALKTGKADAIMADFFAITSQANRGEVRKILALSDYLPGRHWYRRQEWLNQVIVSRRDLASQRPELVHKVVTAILRGTDFVNRHKKWSVRKMVSYSGYSEEAARAVYPLLTYNRNGGLLGAGLANVRQFLIEYSLVSGEQVPLVGDLYTMRFICRPRCK